jgi:hypothetical protein
MPILGIIASQDYVRTPPNSYESIATVTVGSGGSASVNFTSIPATYTHLQVRCLTRSAYPTSEWFGFYLTFNSDTGSNYSYHLLRGTGAAVSGGGAANQTYILNGYMPSNGYTSGIFAPFVIDVLDYANTNKNKTARILGGFDTNNTGTENGTLAFHSGCWRNTNAITSLQLSAGGSYNLVEYSQFALYGIKGA